MKTKDPKQDWPQYMKDQYNLEIRRRRNIKKILDDRYCPQIWTLPLNETTVFSTLAYVFKFNYVIERILQKFFGPEDRKRLLLSEKYLQLSRHIFPGYYSDRERIIVMLNRYQLTGDLEGFVKWLPFHKDKGNFHLVNLMLGLFFLDQYLNNLRREELLSISLSHLVKGQSRFKTIEAKLAFNTLIAFARYMNQDFQGSKLHIVNELNEDQEFQEKFLQLVDKEAA